MGTPSSIVNSATKIAEVAEKIAKALDKVHFLKKEGQGIYIKVPEKICQYDVIVKVQDWGIASANILFPLPEVEHIIGTCMPSLYSLHDSIHKVENGFVLSIGGIPTGTDLVLLQFQYNIASLSFIHNLVESSVSAEPVECNDRDEYWMHAQLKFPQILQKAYSHLRLQDVDLNVDVAVDNEIKTAVPLYVTRGLRTIRKLLSQTDRNLAHAALMEYMQSKKRIGTDVYSLITELNSIFLPLRFRNFVEVTPPFKYFGSEQGTDFRDFPGQVVPKTMKVVSRTDLSLETPAKEGKVIYKKHDLLLELEKVFK